MDRKEALAALKLDRDAKPAEASSHRGWWIAGIGIVVIAVALAVSWWVFLRPRAVPVHTVAVTSQGGNTGVAGGGAILNASGYVVAELQATVSSQITGMIDSVSVDEGMHVEKNQILARLDDRAAHAAVAGALSQLYTDRASVAQARAQLSQGKLTLARNESLIKQHMISQAALNTAQTAVAIDKATLDHAEGQIKVDQDNLHLSQIQLSYTLIRAPFAGVVTEKFAHPGEMISPAAVGGFTQTGICTVVDMKSLELDVDVNEAYIQRVHAGQKVEAVLDAYPNWRIPAHVINVVPTANSQKGTVKVRIAFDKLESRILPQMSVQAFFYSSKKNANQASQIARIEIPKAAVHGSRGNRYVYLVEGGHVKKHGIKIAPATGNGKVTVLSGLSGGEQLIVSAKTPLHDGEAVQEQSQ